VDETIQIPPISAPLRLGSQPRHNPSHSRAPPNLSAAFPINSKQLRQICNDTHSASSPRSTFRRVWRRASSAVDTTTATHLDHHARGNIAHHLLIHPFPLHHLCIQPRTSRAREFVRSGNRAVQRSNKTAMSRQWRGAGIRQKCLKEASKA